MYDKSNRYCKAVINQLEINNCLLKKKKDMNRSTNFATNTRIPFKKLYNLRKQQKIYMAFGLVMSSNTQQKKPTYPIRNIHYFKHWLLQFYTFTLRRTFFQRTKRHSVKWTSDHPPLPGNREEKTPAGVILQQEVLVRNKELTSSHKPGFWRGQQEVNKRWETAVQRS